MRGGVLLAMLSFAGGAGAAVIAAIWLLLTWRNGLAPPLPEDLADIEQLLAVRQMMVAFTLILPALATASIIAGFVSWRQPAARIGIACAAAALTVYALVLHAGFGALA